MKLLVGNIPCLSSQMNKPFSFRLFFVHIRAALKEFLLEVTVA